MKMTMHIDDGLLERVMKAYGYESKTEAVAESLRDMDRRAKLAKFKTTGLGFSANELRESVSPGYDVVTSRMVAEPKVTYGRRAR